MANYTYNPQRLRFVHNEDLFPDLISIKEYLLDLDFLSKRPHVYAEPMVFKYGDEKDPNIVLAIGSVEGGTEGNAIKDNNVFLIDFAGLQKHVNELQEEKDEVADSLKDTIDKLAKLKDACGVEEDYTYVSLSEDEILASAQSLLEADKALSTAIISVKTKLNEKIDEFKAEYDEHVAKSKFNPQETSSIVWNVEEGTLEEGTVVTAKLKLPATIDFEKRGTVLGQLETENSLLMVEDHTTHIGHEGLFLNVTVTSKDGKATLWVNDIDYDISTDGKYISDAAYDKATEQIVFTYTDGESLRMSVEELISEWRILDNDDVEQLKSGVVLERKRIKYNDENNFADVLTAKLNLADDELNMADLVNDSANNRYGLFVSKQPLLDEIERAEQAEQKLQDAIEAEVSRAQDAEAVLQGNIEEEIEAREEADNATNTILSTLIGTVGTNPDGSANPYLTEEVFYVKGENVKVDIKTLDNELKNVNTNIESLSNDLNAEVTRATEAEEGLSEKISNIVTTLGANADGTAKPYSAEVYTYIKGEVVADDLKVLDQTLAATSAALSAEENRATNTEETLQGNIDAEAETRKEADTALENKIDELTTKFGNVTGENAIVVDENKKITLKINEKDNFSNRVMSQDTEGLAIKFGLNYDRRTGDGIGDAEAAYIQLLDASGVMLSEINVSDFIMDGVLGDVELNQETGDLTFTFNEADGKEKKITINLKDYIQPYEDGNGIEITETTKINVKIDERSEEFLTVGHYGLKLSGVQNAINATVQAAANAEAAARTEAYNDLVGKIEAETERAEEAEDTLDKKIEAENKRAEKVEKDLDDKIEAVKTASNTEVVADTALHQETNTVTTDHLDVTLTNASDGHPRYTLTLKDIASGKLLKEEIDRAKEAEGTLTTNLAAEVTRATEAEGTLTTNLANEVTRATGEEAKIREELANAQNAATTTVVKGETDMTNAHLTVTEGERDGHKEFVINVLDVASAEGLATEITDRTNADTTLQNNIDDEVSRAKTEEGKLQTNIDTEETERKSADAEINSKLSNMILAIGAQETGAATVYDSNDKTVYVYGVNINTDIKNLDAQLQVDEARIAAVESHADDNTTAIEDEVKRAKAAETTLQANIDAAVANGKTELVLNDETETVEHLRLKENSNEDGHTTYTLGIVDVASQTDITKVENSLNNEIDRAKVAEAKATTEVERATEATTSKYLTVNKSYGENGQSLYTLVLNDVASAAGLTAEINRAVEAEGTIASNLDGEIKRAKEEEAKLESAINSAKQEAQTKINLDSGYDLDGHLFLNLADTGDTYGQYVYTIGVKDVASATGLAEEISRAKGREDEIERNLNDEITRSKTSDTQHTTDINALNTNLTAEINRAKGREDEIESKLNNENERAIKAEQRAFVSSENTSTIEIIPKYVNDTEKVITANVKRLNDTSNIVQITEGGLYASVTLDYNAIENKLTFNNGLSVQNITLSEHTLVQSAYYDSEEKAIILTVVYANGTKDIKLPVADLVNSITDVNNTLSSAIEALQLKDSEFTTEISTIKDSIKDLNTDLTITNSDLTATQGDLANLSTKLDKEISDRTNGDKTLSDTLSTLTQTVAQNKADASQALTDAKADLNASIAETNKNLGVLEGKVDGEISRSTQKDAEHTEAITALQSSNSNVLDRVSTLSEDLATEKATREENDKRLEGKIDEEVTDRKKAITDLYDLVTSDIATETANREKADSRLDSLISAEETARIAGDNAIKELLDSTKTSLENRVSSAESSMGESIEAAKSDLQGQINTAKTDLQGQITALDTKLIGQINTAKTDLTTQMGTMQSTLETKISSAKSDLEKDIAATNVTVATKASTSDLNTAIGNLRSELTLTLASKEALNQLSQRILLLEEAFQRLYNDGYVTP